MDSLISIIIPVYQAESWLKRCIESVLDQTYTNIEIILINDGSTDNSGAICEEFAKKDDRIIVIHKQNEGPSVSRNKGLETAKGEYVQFVDSDDWLEKNACEILIRTMVEDNSDLAICGFNITKNNRSIRKPHLPRKKYNLYKNSDDFFEVLKLLASPCNKLYKKTYLSSFFDEELSAGEDLRFNISYLRETGNITSIPKSLYNVSLDNDQSLNRTFRNDRLDIFLENQKLLFGFCNDFYGSNYNFRLLYTKSILGAHAHFREVCKHSSKKEAHKIIECYSNNKNIEKACKEAKTSRFDYKIFHYLLKEKRNKEIYNFIKLRLLLEKLSNK